MSNIRDSFLSPTPNLSPQSLPSPSLSQPLYRPSPPSLNMYSSDQSILNTVVHNPDSSIRILYQANNLPSTSQDHTTTSNNYQVSPPPTSSLMNVPTPTATNHPVPVVHRRVSPPSFHQFDPPPQNGPNNNHPLTLFSTLNRSYPPVYTPPQRQPPDDISRSQPLAFIDYGEFHQGDFSPVQTSNDPSMDDSDVRRLLNEKSISLEDLVSNASSLPDFPS